MSTFECLRCGRSAGQFYATAFTGEVVSGEGLRFLRCAVPLCGGHVLTSDSARQVRKVLGLKTNKEI